MEGVGRLSSCVTASVSILQTLKHFGDEATLNENGKICEKCEKIWPPSAHQFQLLLVFSLVRFGRVCFGLFVLFSFLLFKFLLT